MPGKPLKLEEKEEIKTLHASGLTFNAIAEKLSKSPHTIKSYLSKPEIQNQVAEKRSDLISLFESVAQRNLESITDEDIKAVSSYQRTLSAAVATDKLRLLKGESTDNISIIIKTLQELKGMLDEE